MTAWTNLTTTVWWLLDEHGLLMAFVLLLLEESGLPPIIPGDLLMVLVGLQAAQGRVPLIVALVVLEVATVSLPVSSWKAYAVPPPIAAATIATAASRAKGPRARFFGAGAVGSTMTCCTGGCAGGGGHSGFTGEEACCGVPWGFP